MRQKIFNIFISFIIIGLGALTLPDHYKENDKLDIPVKNLIKLEQPEFLMSENPKEDLIKVLDYYDIQHPEIVYAQAILETGNFKSRIFKEYNNLFGLYDSRTHSYYKFDHWAQSVVGYKNYIQYRYNPSSDDYYKFLSDIGYAEDPEYIHKLKKIVKQYDKRRTSDTITVTNTAE